MGPCETETNEAENHGVAQGDPLLAIAHSPRPRLPLFSALCRIRSEQGQKEACECRGLLQKNFRFETYPPVGPFPRGWYVYRVDGVDGPEEMERN